MDVPAICGPDAISRGLFRVRLSGDSMTPAYKTGSIVEFECLREGYHTMALDMDYYVQRNDGTATFKRFEGIEDDTLIFRAINRKKFPGELVVERREIVRMAIAKGIFTPVGQ
jgi:phage repressor protein C with HTH and peptisase S24 domain